MKNLNQFIKILSHLINSSIKINSEKNRIVSNINDWRPFIWTFFEEFTNINQIIGSLKKSFSSACTFKISSWRHHRTIQFVLSFKLSALEKMDVRNKAIFFVSSTAPTVCSWTTENDYYCWFMHVVTKCIAYLICSKRIILDIIILFIVDFNFFFHVSH